MLRCGSSAIWLSPFLLELPKDEEALPASSSRSLLLLQRRSLFEASSSSRTQKLLHDLFYTQVYPTVSNSAQSKCPVQALFISGDHGHDGPTGSLHPLWLLCGSVTQVMGALHHGSVHQFIEWKTNPKKEAVNMTSHVHGTSFSYTTISNGLCENWCALNGTSVRTSFVLVCFNLEPSTTFAEALWHWSDELRITG